MAALTVKVSIKEMEPFKKLIKIAKKVIEDNRIPEDIRKEYLDEFKSIYESEVTNMCEQNTLPADEVVEEVNEALGLTEESNETDEESGEE